MHLFEVNCLLVCVKTFVSYFVNLILQTSMNARMITMEVALTDVPIPVEATSVHADVATNFREKMEHQEAELVVWLWTQVLMPEGPVKVICYTTLIMNSV